MDSSFNPALDQFTVEGFMEQGEEIELSVRNIAGTEISEIIPTTAIPAGPFSFKISEQHLARLASGVYVICLRTGDISHFEKLILIR
jgi:hypothetical protein